MTLDVIIAGAGPTGLMLACELGLAGIRATVLEKLPSPTGLSKALGLQARSMEMLDHRGLLERFGTGRSAPPFANFAMFQLDLHAIPFGHPYGLIVPQADIEQVLEARARELGAEIRRAHEITDLHQEEGLVRVGMAGPNGAYEERCRYLVGCDGGHSAVRKLSGIDFPGLGPKVVARFADVTVGAEAGAILERAVPELHQRGFGIARTANGNFAIAPIGSGITRVAAIEWDQPQVDRDVPMTLDELQQALERVIGTELPMSEPRWMTRATDTSRQAERYREGRVLLAGDAAHVHFAYGGMGLQTGIQDAGNLGWKLAAQIHGWAPSDLLDTYDTERQPVGKRVLMATRAATALARPGEHITALRELVSELLKQEQVFRTIIEMITSVDVHYEVDIGGGDRHPLLGHWAPDLPLASATGKTRVPQLMHRARAVLLVLADRPALRDAAAGWSDRVDLVTARCEAQPAPADAFLIRPDGYIAWVVSAQTADDEAERQLRYALARWFGPKADPLNASANSADSLRDQMRASA
jgi:2-polyprenyl-6-methoxyphenol hydroxylase-like FAD-dependent oxidoreductase